jgi:glucokinase
VALIVDHQEDVATHVPMVSRILHLLVIDILAVGVAMKLEQQGGAALPDVAIATKAELDDSGPAAPADATAPPATALRVAPGISSAGPLARLTSHSR